MEVEHCARLRTPKRDAMARIDELKRSLFSVIAESYGDEYYAKLLALKISNYAAAKYHFTNRHAHVASQPVSLTQEPSNACQLRCPGCVHTENPTWRESFLWPRSMMKTDAFSALLRRVGPFAFNLVYFNYGEPLLNKSVPDCLRVSNGYGMSAFFSTNLSLKFDVEQFVAARPERVILSIDGITQESYARFRKRGNLGLVLENVERLVAAKHELGTNRPHLIWRMFTFEHNVHEVERAIELARKMGVNEIDITTPFDVSADDPGVRVAHSESRGTHVFEPWTPRTAEDTLGGIIRNPEVESAFDARWVDRIDPDDEERESASASTCIWLYFNMTVDGAQRLSPCCIAPTNDRRLIFGSTSDPAADHYNLPDFVLSRRAFADRRAFERETQMRAADTLPFCAECTVIPEPAWPPNAIISDLQQLDFRQALGADEGAYRALMTW